MTAITEILSSGSSSVEQAMAAFDALEPANCEFMYGRWQGEELATGHAMNGLLDAIGWYGKAFVDTEQVHPLLFHSADKVIMLEPRLLFAGMGLAGIASKFPLLIKAFSLIKPLLRTRKSRARLRMTEYRGKLSATMIYDQLPINDVFRKIDDNTLLGLMDMKGLPQPFFFILRRETRA